MSSLESVLYVGSGLSAKAAKGLADKVTLCCAVNNAWRVFDPEGVDYWLCPGDFPPENYPPPRFPHKPINYCDFKDSSQNVFARFGEEYQFPQHHAGYTTFFQGLYWLFDKVQPKRIYLLGFDHDYDPQKVELWESQGQPAPNNNYGGTSPPSVEKWANEFFKDCPVDAIYGHGTPDPLRLGAQAITELFLRAQDYAERLGIEVFNVSGVTHGLNTFPQFKL